MKKNPYPRQLTEVESRNLAAINELGIESALLYVYWTALDKYTFDATAQIRSIFLKEGFHDYVDQGQDNKCEKQGLILTDDNIKEAKCTIFRPKTKKGDPRFWISKFNHYAKDGDFCSVFIIDEKICIYNITKSRIHSYLKTGIITPTTDLLHFKQKIVTSLADRLLIKLKKIAAIGPLKSLGGDDSAVGVTVEAALKIPKNSSKKPDYKDGIELKNSKSRKTRGGLFCKTPNWELSKYKDWIPFLDDPRFGYLDKKNRLAYRNTTSALVPNSKGLILSINNIAMELHESFHGPPKEKIFAWELETLHSCLAIKHPETFWIDVDQIFINKEEHFILKSVVHTKKPIPEQFDRLIIDGSITLDHMIEEVRNIKSGKRRGYEQGPQFKIKRSRKSELFLGKPQTYSLIP